MASLQEKLVGAYGSDIYAAGTYYVGGNRGNNLRYPVFAFEYAGSNFVISNAKDSSGGEIEQNWLNDGTSITADAGLMVCREDVYQFTTDATVKVWYAK